MGKVTRTRAPVELAEEYTGAQLGDARLNARLVSSAQMMWEKPDSSFPKAAANDAELEATYRFLNNERVSPSAILAPHVRQTVRRASACEAGARGRARHDGVQFRRVRAWGSRACRTGRELRLLWTLRARGGGERGSHASGHRCARDAAAHGQEEDGRQKGPRRTTRRTSSIGGVASSRRHKRRSPRCVRST